MSKESHSFHPDVAKKVGVNAAIIFGHLIFLHKANLDRKDVWDGFRYWIKKTAKAFSAMYPYLTPKEIRGALNRLEKDGYITSVAGLSENKFDRAKSFSIEQLGFDLYEIDENERHVFTCDKRANGNLPKGKSDVTQRANQMLPKGQMNNSYNSCSSSNKKECSLDFSNFDNPESAKAIFARWLKYRTDIKKPYKSNDTLKSSLKLLFRYSNGVSKIAEQVIENSIGNGYQGFFELKTVSAKKDIQQPQQTFYTPPAKRFGQ